MPDWGKARGVPEVCPYGITVETLPKRPQPKPAPTYVAARLAACGACEEADCALKHCKPCRLKALCRQPNMACPKEKWLPVVVGIAEKIVDPGAT